MPWDPEQRPASGGEDGAVEGEATQQADSSSTGEDQTGDSPWGDRAEGQDPWKEGDWNDERVSREDAGAPHWEWEAFPGTAEPSLLAKVVAWFNGRKSGDSDSTDDDEEVGTVVSEAQDRVYHFESCGQRDRHEEYLGDSRYRGSLEYALASAVQTLARRIEQYMADMRSSSDWILAKETSGRRVAVLHAAIGAAERSREYIHTKKAETEDLWMSGRTGWSKYESRMEALCKKEQLTIRLLDMGGLGMTMQEISDISDQSGHILEDSQADDDGEMRQKIAMKIRSMPRRMALEIIEQAVADGMISEETARYLIREYVRSR